MYRGTKTCRTAGCTAPSFRSPMLDSSWNVMAHGGARERKWRGNWRMEWIASKSHVTAGHRLTRAVQTLQADVHNSPASSRLNWRPCRFKWTRPFRRKTKYGFRACAITFQTQSTAADMRTPRLLVVDWTEAPAYLNGLVRFAERRNLVSARVPSHFKRSLLPLMRTPRLPVVDWTEAPADLNSLVRFAERRNLVSARVPSHLHWPLLQSISLATVL
jgi:hypothetical protein